MQPPADSVSGVLPDQFVASRPYKTLHCGGDVAHPGPGSRGQNALFQCTPSDLDQFPFRLIPIAGDQRDRRVTVKAIDDCADVQLHQVTVLDYPVARNAVDDLFVQGCADHTRERNRPRDRRISEERRFGAPF